MKNIFPFTLSIYLIKIYTLNLLFLLAGLLCVVYLFDMVELLRRASKVDNLPFSILFQMGLFKLPEVGQLLIPFAVLFSAMFTFWQLGRHNEITVIRSSGLSIWQFLAPITFVVVLIGIVQITLINPLGALFISKYEKLETNYLDRSPSSIMLSGQGLWLRQNQDSETVLLHAKKIKVPEWELQNVILFLFDKENNFTRRLDAPSAHLKSGQWVFKNATLNRSQQKPQFFENIAFPTNLTIQELEESFAPAKTISFWKLKSYIDTMEETGLDATQLKVYFQNLLSQPLLYIAMVLLAASVSLSPARMQGTSVMILFGVAIGFVIFFVSSFLQALGTSQQIPVLIAAWFPAIISFLLGVAALMSLEDG